MYRVHMHVSVPDMDEAIRFYGNLFNAPPTAVRDDYAKWFLDDPGINFAVSLNTSPDRTGLDHVGIQADTRDEFAALDQRLQENEPDADVEGCVHCCYAVSDKTSVVDPAGLVWETYVTHSDSEHWETIPVEPDHPASR